MNLRRKILLTLFAFGWLALIVAGGGFSLMLVRQAADKQTLEGALIGLIACSMGLLLLSAAGFLAYAIFRIRQLSVTRKQFGHNHNKTNHIAASIGRLRMDVNDCRSRTQSLEEKLTTIDQRNRQILENFEREARITRSKSEHPLLNEFAARGEMLPPTKRKMTATPGKTAGRNAAAFDGDKNAGRNLAFLITAPQRDKDTARDSLVPTADGITTKSLAGVFNKCELDFQALQPFICTEQRRRSSAFLIIEDRALSTGAWSGAIQSQGTHLYRDLRNLIIQAKNDGCAIIYVATDNIPNHHDSELKTMSDLIIRSGTYDLSWAPDGTLPFVNEAALYQLGQA